MPDASHVPPRRLSDLAGPDRRLLILLRLWPRGPEAQARAWDDLCGALGSARARGCLSAFEDLRGRLWRSAWVAPLVAAPEDERLTPDEEAILTVVRLATEGDREAALEHAMFLVRPEALLPVVLAAERAGLPLLCAECRARLGGCHGRA